MFLHAGNNKDIRESDIIGIFDMDSATMSPITRKYLAEQEKAHKVISISNELPKSFLVVKNGNDTLLYISPISPQALYGRMNEQTICKSKVGKD